MNEIKRDTSEIDEYSEENEFCINLAQTFLATFRELKSSTWYKQAIPRTVPLPHIVGETPEDTEHFERLLALLPDMKLPVGTCLRCVINGDWSFENHSSFYFLFPDGRNQMVEFWPVDGCSIRAVWEKRLLAWASSQFYLFWHAGYSEERIIIDQSDFNCKSLFCEQFLASLDESSRKRFDMFDFKPKAFVQNGMAIIRYYTFASFGGIFENEAVELSEKLPEYRPVFPYECDIIY